MVLIENIIAYVRMGCLGVVRGLFGFVMVRGVCLGVNWKKMVIDEKQVRVDCL
jgi:hypothetical protein